MHKIVAKWAEDNNVSTVNRSYGEQTTAPVSLAALENLVRAAILEERDACANVCDAIAHDWRGANSQAVECAKAIRASSNA